MMHQTPTLTRLPAQLQEIENRLRRRAAPGADDVCLVLERVTEMLRLLQMSWRSARGDNHTGHQTGGVAREGGLHTLMRAADEGVAQAWRAALLDRDGATAAEALLAILPTLNMAHVSIVKLAEGQEGAEAGAAICD